METAGVEPTVPRCKRGALPPERPLEVRTDGVEPPQPEASDLQTVELTCAQRPRKRGSRSGSNRHCGTHTPGCCLYTTATTDGDDRIRTGNLSPDKRVLSALSYASEIAQVGFEPTVSSS